MLVFSFRKWLTNPVRKLSQSRLDKSALEKSAGEAGATPAKPAGVAGASGKPGPAAGAERKTGHSKFYLKVCGTQTNHPRTRRAADLISGKTQLTHTKSLRRERASVCLGVVLFLWCIFVLRETFTCMLLNYWCCLCFLFNVLCARVPSA